ncbi:MAG TPA: metal ABC transporter ATP-binding protein [Acidimicrobiales bacterium]|nr:metal ABC transporter ATP-binding protein [Acidimicrobiales bacterium]
MTSVLAACGVSFSYGVEPVVSDVTFSVAAGEFAALVGPNGSGKSTLLRLLLGLAAPSAGRVELFGAEPSRLRERWRVGYVPQRPAVASDFPGTVEEVVAAGRLSRTGWRGRMRREDRAEIDHAMESVALGDLRTRRVRELSGGQQQRAFIAKALASQPELLVLDEPVAGVDAESQRRFRDSLVHLIDEHSAAVLLVSHELGAVADVLDRVVVLKRTVLFDGPPGDLAERGVSLGIHAEDLPLWLEELH